MDNLPHFGKIDFNQGVSGLVGSILEVICPKIGKRSVVGIIGRIWHQILDSGGIHPYPSKSC